MAPTVEEKAQSKNRVVGYPLFTPATSMRELEYRINSGHVIQKTLITKQYSYTQYLRERDDKSILLYILREDRSIEFYSPDMELQAQAGDTVVNLSFPDKKVERVKERLKEEVGKTQVKKEQVEDAFHKLK